MAIKIILPFEFLNFLHDFHQNPSKNNRNRLKTTWFSWKLIKIHQHIIKPDFSVSLRGHEGVSPEQRPLWPAEKMNFSISLQMNKKMCRNTLKQSKTIKLIVFERFWAQLSVFQPPIEPRQVTSVEPIKTTTDMAQKGHAAGILSVRMSLPPSKKCLRCFFDLSDIARPSFWASPTPPSDFRSSLVLSKPSISLKAFSSIFGHLQRRLEGSKSSSSDQKIIPPASTLWVLFRDHFFSDERPWSPTTRPSFKSSKFLMTRHDESVMRKFLPFRRIGNPAKSHQPTSKITSRNRTNIPQSPQNKIISSQLRIHIQNPSIKSSKNHEALWKSSSDDNAERKNTNKRDERGGGDSESQEKRNRKIETHTHTHF